MSLFNWLFGCGSSADGGAQSAINPVNGAPMANDAIDVLGNPLGTSDCLSAGLGSGFGAGTFDFCPGSFDSGSCFDHTSYFDYSSSSTHWE